MYTYVPVCACLHVCMHVPVWGSHRGTLGFLLHCSLHLNFWNRASVNLELTGFASFHPRNPPASPFSVLGLHTHHYAWLFMRGLEPWTQVLMLALTDLCGHLKTWHHCLSRLLSSSSNLIRTCYTWTNFSLIPEITWAALHIFLMSQTRKSDTVKISNTTKTMWNVAELQSRPLVPRELLFQDHCILLPRACHSSCRTDA